MMDWRDAPDLLRAMPFTEQQYVNVGVSESGHRLKTVNTGVTRIRRRTINEFLDAVERAA